MNKKILQLKFFMLFVCCFNMKPLQALAQQVKGGDSAVVNIDSLSKNKVNLPFNIVVNLRFSSVSTQSVYNQSIVKHPVTSVTNALSGRIAGLNTQQTSGQPGLNAVSLTLRGRTPLILIDGIPRLLTTISLEEIESVTVLKDAMSTALLGVRGANGAIAITTRQGFNGKERISFTVQSASQRPLEMRRALNAFDYATLRNEAIDNELLVNPFFNTGLRYSAADLQAFKDGSDPLGHPDVDYRNSILNSRASFTRYALDMTGGGSAVTYYAGLEHYKQNGLFKSNTLNNYETNNSLSSYIVRSNININVSPSLSGGIHLFGRIGNANEPGATTAAIYDALLTTPSTSYPLFNPNGSLGGTDRFRQNIYGQTVESGYRQNFRRDLISDFYLKKTLDEITPGLYVKGLVSYAAYLNEETNRSKPVVAYQRFVSPTGAESYSNALTQPAAQTNVSVIPTTNGQPGVGQGRQTYFELSTGYSHVFDAVHNVDAVVIGNMDKNVYGANIPYTVQGLSGKASYTYSEKYIAEVASSYSGSNYYSGESHYKMGFFPVVGLGWVISNEFFKGSRKLNYLKLSVNYGKTGNDNPGYFSYLQRLVGGNTVYFGTSPTSVATVIEGTPSNDITFESANKLNVNLQGALLNDRLSFSADYYNNTFKDLLMQRGRNTSLLGNTYPNENIGRNRYTGFDFQLQPGLYRGNQCGKARSDLRRRQYRAPGCRSSRLNLQPPVQ